MSSVVGVALTAFNKEINFLFAHTVSQAKYLPAIFNNSLSVHLFEAIALYIFVSHNIAADISSNCLGVNCCLIKVNGCHLVIIFSKSSLANNSLIFCMNSFHSNGFISIPTFLAVLETF